MEVEKSCGTIIIDNDKVLMIKQVNEEKNYSFPKGHMEPGETEKETAIRETKEETNLDVEIISEKKYTLSYIMKKKNGNIKEVIYFLAKLKGTNKIIKQEKEITDIKWIELDKVSDYIIYEDTKKMWEEVYSDIKNKTL